jgi:hypothetical protein
VTLRLTLLAALIATSTAASAHHGTAPYFDLDNIARVEGEIVAVSWRNPHVTFQLRRIDDGGRNEIWQLEEWDSERVIHLGDAVDPATQPRTPLGYSVGRWEDARTLVVTTTRISDPYFDDEGTPQSADAVVTERFTLSEDETRLDYESIHDDPYAFMEPARQSSYWDWTPGEVIRRFDCVVQ